MHTYVIFRALQILVQLKLIFFICLFIANITAAFGENIGDTTTPHYYPWYQFSKATIQLIDGSKITMQIMVVEDSTLKVIIDDTAYKRISISEIRSIKVKRGSVANGLGCGAFTGVLLGYVVGYVAYDLKNFPDENTDDAKMRGLEGAIIGLVPGAVIGGIIGGIFTKRHFKINGDIKKVRKMLKALSYAQA
jgi:hypothetical protein